MKNVTITLTFPRTMAMHSLRDKNKKMKKEKRKHKRTFRDIYGNNFLFVQDLEYIEFLGPEQNEDIFLTKAM